MWRNGGGAFSAIAPQLRNALSSEAHLAITLESFWCQDVLIYKNIWALRIMTCTDFCTMFLVILKLIFQLL